MKRKVNQKGKPSADYPEDLLSVGEVKECIEGMKKLKNWIENIYPEEFPNGKCPGFTIATMVILKKLINYENLKRLIK